MSDEISGSAADRQVAAQRSLIGQPVRLERQDDAPQAVLRLCVGARLVTEAWSPERRRHNAMCSTCSIASPMSW